MTRHLKFHAIALLLAALVLLPAISGCAGNRRGDRGPGQRGPGTETGENDRGREEERPIAGNRTIENVPASHQKFLAEGYLEADPSLVSEATGAGDPGSFKGEVIDIVVDQNHPNADDNNSGSADAPLKTIGAAFKEVRDRAGRDQFFHVVIHEGVYRERVDLTGVKGRNLRLLLEGEGDVQIKGSQVAEEWESIGNGRYAHRWPADWGSWIETSNWKQHRQKVPEPTVRWAEEAGPLFHRREMIYLDGQVQRQVLEENELRDGRFFVDEANDRLIFDPPAGVDPNSAFIEIAVEPSVFNVERLENSTIRNLSVSHSSSPTLSFLSHIRYCDNLVLEDLSFIQSSFRGLGIYDNKTITMRRVEASDNGANGMGMGGNWNLIMDGCTTNDNNWRGDWADTRSWAVGGVKIVYTRTGLIRNHTSLRNKTFGYWLDLDNVNVTLENCNFSNNMLAGLFLEAGRGPMLVRNSRMNDNVNHGVLVVNVSSVTLQNNEMSGNGISQIFWKAYGRKIESTFADVTEDKWNQHVHLIGNTVRTTEPDQYLWSSTMKEEGLKRSFPTLVSNNNTWITSTPETAFMVRGQTFGYDRWKREANEGKGSVLRSR